MPRKVSYGVDFDYGYDDGYDDFDDYYEGDHNDVVESPEPVRVNDKRPGVWSCGICTYDNEESMSVCDICGVIRNPVSGDFKNELKNGKRTAGKMCNDFGVSIMAKSLFTSLPHQRPQKTPVVQSLNEDFLTKGGNSFHIHGNSQRNFDPFHDAFGVHSHPRVHIVPFKFDAPSPDDLVSNGLHSSKASKASLINLKPPKVSSSTEKNGATHGSASAKSTAVPAAKGMQGKMDKVNHSRNEMDSIPLSSTLTAGSSFSSTQKQGHIVLDEEESLISRDKTSDGTSTSLPKGRSKRVDARSSSSIDGEKVHSLAVNMNKVSLSDNPGNDKKSKSDAPYRPENWMLPDKAGDMLTQLNLAIVGHVDSGKSTLSGRLLHLLGRITQKEMHKYEKEAKMKGKGSFSYAWALDESPEERERGITMTVAVAYFDSKKYHVVLLDSPGHKDFVPNMISGATQADAAILVIDASTGAFEAGLDSTKGQTREHAQLIRSFGVDQLIVAINKMDIVGYSKDRYDSIKAQLGTFLRSCGFKDSSILWVPLSAIENQNLVSPPSDDRLSSWYRGPYLLDAVDSLQPPARDFSKPVLMPICDVIRSTSQGQISACGKLEAGALRSGSKVLVMPSGEIATVKSLERDSQPCTVARAGDSIAVNLSGVEVGNVMAGGVLCHPDYPVAVAKHLELKVFMLDRANPLLKGSQLEFHIHHAKEAARVVNIASLLDPKTGNVIKKVPRCLLPKQSAIIEVALEGPVCVDKFSNSKALGRASLRALGRTIALGIVTRIIEELD